VAGIIDPDAAVGLGAVQSGLLISVIIPAFDNPDGLRTCLDALTRQSVATREFEAIVVDDGSSPPLANVVQDFTDRLQITYIRVSNGGPATARNHGAAAAKGCYLAFTDHDCAPAPEWVSALRDAFFAKPDRMLGGPKQNGLPDNLYASAHQIASNYAEQWFQSAPAGYFTTNNLAVPRKTFLEMGGFNESFRFAQEDREFGARWAERGLLRAWTPGAVVVHRHSLTLFSFLRQQFRYGSGAVAFRTARGRAQARRRIRFEGLRFHLGLVGAPFMHHQRQSLKLAAMLASAQVMYLAGVLAASMNLDAK